MKICILLILIFLTYSMEINTAQLPLQNAAKQIEGAEIRKRIRSQTVHHCAILNRVQLRDVHFNGTILDDPNSEAIECFFKCVAEHCFLIMDGNIRVLQVKEWPFLPEKYDVKTLLEAQSCLSLLLFPITTCARMRPILRCFEDFYKNPGYEFDLDFSTPEQLKAAVNVYSVPTPPEQETTGTYWYQDWSRKPYRRRSSSSSSRTIDSE